MIVALITPHYFPSVRGNSITVQRIESGLRNQGVQAQVFSLDRMDPGQILAVLRRVPPHLVHGFHATASGAVVAQVARALAIPSAITVTGTDVNQDLLDATRRPLVEAALDAASAVVVFHETIAAKVRREVPTSAAKIRVINQAALCDGSRYDLRAALKLDPSDFVFFQAAGLRRVKNIPMVIPPLAALQREYPQVRFVLAGPVIEPEEATEVTGMLRGLPWATYVGVLDHAQACGSLSGVQVVINSSLSEGGMSNAVLEAMSKGVPVLASDIEGNRSVIVDGRDGFLFASATEFMAKAKRLLSEPALRAMMGDRARTKVARQFHPQGEIDNYLALYQDLAAGRGG